MSEYKYLIFLIGSVLCVPAGILIASQWRKFNDFIFVFLVFGTCMPSGLFGFPTDINFLSREWYRGTTRGIEISYLDLLAIILLVGSIAMRNREGKAFFRPPTLILLLLYFFWCSINVVVFSDPKIFGLFELTKIARAILLFTAVAAYIRSPRELEIFVWALVGTVFYETLVCLRDRYVFHHHRIRGTLAHPNSLSMYSLQMAPIFIATLFARDAPKLLRAACIFAFLAASGCVLLSISRMGFASLVLLSAAAFLCCTGFRISVPKVVLAILGTILMTVMVAKSWDTIMSRLGGFDLEREYLSDEGDRGRYFRAARPALADNPIAGVGLNNWSWWISKRYGVMAGFDMVPYTSTYHDEKPLGGGGRAAPAHNFYLLTLTELGIPGLVLWLLFIFQSLWISGIAIVRRAETLPLLIRVGAFLSTCGVLMQSWTEWEFRQTSMFFLGHIILGVSAALYYYTRKQPAVSSPR